MKKTCPATNGFVVGAGLFLITIGTSLPNEEFAFSCFIRQEAEGTLASFEQKMLVHVGIEVSDGIEHFGSEIAVGWMPTSNTAELEHVDELLPTHVIDGADLGGKGE